jgi:hypothetical protein
MGDESGEEGSDEEGEEEEEEESEDEDAGKGGKARVAKARFRCRANTLNRFQDFYLKAKAIIWR